VSKQDEEDIEIQYFTLVQPFVLKRPKQQKSLAIWNPLSPVNACYRIQSCPTTSVFFLLCKYLENFTFLSVALWGKS
jgi:hypothetical protein